MNWKRVKALSTLSVISMAALLLVVSMPAAHACNIRQSVSGTLFLTGPPPPPVIKTIGNNIQIWDLSNGPMAWTGGIAGTGPYDGHWLFLNYGTDKMHMYGVGEQTLSAVVNGKAGTLKIAEVSWATNSEAGGSWRIIYGTGGLANIHGEGTITGIDMSMGVYAYTGQIYFNR